MSVACYSLFVVCRALFAVVRCSWVARCLLFVVGWLSVAACCLQLYFVVWCLVFGFGVRFCCSLFVVCRLLFVVCCLVFAARCLLFVVCCLLFVGCCLMFAVCCMLTVDC